MLRTQCSMQADRWEEGETWAMFDALQAVVSAED